MRYGDACQEKAKMVLPDDSKAIANMIQEANSVLDVSFNKGSAPLGAVQIFKWSESAMYHCF